MDLDTINKIIAMAKWLLADGHSLRPKDTNIIDAEQWAVCYEWIDHNARVQITTKNYDKNGMAVYIIYNMVHFISYLQSGQYRLGKQKT